jgi:hypothetical protein
MEEIGSVPLLILDDFGMRKLPHTAAEDLLEIVMRRYERTSTILKGRTAPRPSSHFSTRVSAQVCGRDDHR